MKLLKISLILNQFNGKIFKFERTQHMLLKYSESWLPILSLYKDLHTVYERFLINNWNSVKINDDLFFISWKFKSMFIYLKLKLTNVQVLIDFKVIYQILTRDYTKF
jgi:hypothetical protein